MTHDGISVTRKASIHNISEVTDFCINSFFSLSTTGPTFHGNNVLGTISKQLFVKHLVWCFLKNTLRVQSQFNMTFVRTVSRYFPVMRDFLSSELKMPRLSVNTLIVRRKDTQRVN